MDREEVQSVLRAWFGMFDAWSMTDDEVCAVTQRNDDWIKQARADLSEGRNVDVDEDLLSRCGYCISIFGSINRILQVPERADAWMRAKNDHYAGRSAIEVMSSGDIDDLKAVAAYLLKQIS